MISAIRSADMCFLAECEGNYRQMTMKLIRHADFLAFPFEATLRVRENTPLKILYSQIALHQKLRNNAQELP